MINGRLLRDATGATAVEYGLIAALIAVAAVSAIGTTGVEVSNTYAHVDTSMAERVGAGSDNGASTGSGDGSNGSSSSGSSSGGNTSGGGSSSGSGGTSSGGGSTSGGTDANGAGGAGSGPQPEPTRTPIRARDRGIPR